MRSARLSAYFGNNALTNLGPRLRSTRECKEPGGGPRVIQSLSDVSDLGLSRPRFLYIPWFVRRLTTDFFREFSDSFALDTADGQVFRSGSKLPLRSRGGRCAVRRAAAPLRVEHPFARIRHADDEHPEMDQRNHHRHAGRFLTAMRGGGGGEDAGRFPFHRARKPEARGRVD